MVFGDVVYGEVPFGEAGDSAPTGTLAASLPLPSAAFAGDYVPPPQSGTLDAVLPMPTVAFAGTYDGTLLGTLDVVLPMQAADFAGTYVPPPVSGTLDAALPLPLLAFSGVSGESGSFAALLLLPSVDFVGSYGGPYPTDTSNLFDGLDLVCLGTVTITRPEVTPPTAPPKYDKALPYPEPVMVDGRPT